MSSNEHVIYSTRFSKRMFFLPFVLSTAALVAAFFFQVVPVGYALYFFWALIVVAVLVMIPPLTKYLSSRFVVTDQRVIIHHGFLSRTSYEMVLKKIEGVTVDQSLVDRFIWGSGTLVITGTGGTKEEFRNVGGAVAFQEHLNEALHAD